MTSAVTLKLRVFRIKDGKVSGPRNVPPYLLQAAKLTYRAVSGYRATPSQTRVEEMAAVCQSLLDEASAGSKQLRYKFRDQESDASKINDILNYFDHDKKRFQWHDRLAEGQALHASNMLAAYGFYQVDSAASHYVDGRHEAATAALALAYEAAFSFSFLWGYADKEEGTRSIGRHTARSTPRMKAIPELKAYAQRRWEEGNDGKRWKSLRTCAHAIATAVEAEAARLGWKDMKDPARTTYGWLREANAAPKSVR